MLSRIKKRHMIIAVAVALICLLLYWLLFHVFYVFDTGIDSFVKPESGPFARVTRGYMRLRTDKSKYDADDTVGIKINTAFYDSQEQAEKAEYIIFTIGCDSNLELVPISFTSEKQPIQGDTDGVYGETVNDDFYALNCVEFDEHDLVYGGPFITRYALPFSADFEIRVKEDAPEEFKGLIKFFAKAGYAIPNSDGMHDRTEENEAFLYVYCKDGKLYLSEKSWKDAMKRAGEKPSDSLVGTPIPQPGSQED